jgi:hypothetical protein
MGRANMQERSLDKRIRDRIAFFVESTTSDKKYLAEAKKRLTHFIAKNLMNKIDENITKKLIVKEKKIKNLFILAMTNTTIEIFTNNWPIFSFHFWMTVYLFS